MFLCSSCQCEQTVNGIPSRLRCGHSLCAKCFQASPSSCAVCRQFPAKQSLSPIANAVGSIWRLQQEELVRQKMSGVGSVLSSGAQPEEAGSDVKSVPDMSAPTQHCQEYLSRPFDYKSMVKFNHMIEYESNRSETFVSPAFLDSTRDDKILISEFSGNRVLLCDRSLHMIKEYNLFRTSKNVFVIKEHNMFLCSDWHRVSLVDMERSVIVWQKTLPKSFNPWGLCMLEQTGQLAVCLPYEQKVVLFDVRSSNDNYTSEWCYNDMKWSNRVLPYAIAPDGTVTAGTSSGYGALMSCDKTTGKPLQVLSRLDRPAFPGDSDSSGLEEPSSTAMLMSSAMTDIALDRNNTCIVPDALNSRIIFRATNGDINVLNETDTFRSPSGVTLLRDGTLVISDNRANTIIICNL